MISVIDYGAGNLRSVENALRYLQLPFATTSQAGEVSRASAIVLPGVGHFGHMMRSLELLGLVPVLREAIHKDVPYLGICLGMHALYQSSEEAPAFPGLGILPDRIRRFPEGLKVPQMGWNQLQVTPGARLFQGIEAGPFVYFAHAYYLPVGEDAASRDPEASPVAALADYGSNFVAAVERNNIFGTQFHPEKSGEIGLRILRNFAALSQKQAKQKSSSRGGSHVG